MRRQRSLSPKSTTSKLLLELDHGLDFWFSMATQRTLILKYGMDGIRKRREIKYRIRQRENMKRLVKRNLLKIEKIADKYIVQLTSNGARELFRLKVLTAPELLNGDRCMVIFDIPESKSTFRKQLRSFLKLSGFTKIQRSVWIIKKDVFNDLTMLFLLNGNFQWVKIFQVYERN